VRFQVADADDLDAIFAGFFWSHVPRAEVRRFARALMDRVEPGGPVILADNRYVEGSSSPIIRTTTDGDTYQSRRLADGRAGLRSTEELPDSRAVRHGPGAC
jgi:hypothetical protein